MGYNPLTNEACGFRWQLQFGGAYVPSNSCKSIDIDRKQVAVEHEVTTPNHTKDHPSMIGPPKQKKNKTTSTTGTISQNNNNNDKNRNNNMQQ